MRWKVCGMREPKNISEVAALQPNYMGFILWDGSKRYCPKPQQVPDQITKVGVFVDADVIKIENAIENYKLGAVQLHGNEDEKFCKELSSFCNVIKAFRIDDTFDLNDIEKYSKYCKYFLFDTFTESYGGSGKKFNWDLLLNYDHKKDFILSGGINLELISSIKKLKNQLPNLIGVDLNSKFEIKPGLKDINRVKKFIKSIKNENT